LPSASRSRIRTTQGSPLISHQFDLTLPNCQSPFLLFLPVPSHRSASSDTMEGTESFWKFSLRNSDSSLENKKIAGVGIPEETNRLLPGTLRETGKTTNGRCNCSYVSPFRSSCPTTELSPPNRCCRTQPRLNRATLGHPNDLRIRCGLSAHLLDATYCCGEEVCTPFSAS